MRFLLPCFLLAPGLADAAPAPRVIVEAAVEGAGSYANKSYFFAGDYYVRYDWSADRVDPGYPAPAKDWPLSPPFGSHPNAALDGQGPYDGKAYVFKDTSYVRYDWATDQIDVGFPAALSAWKLPVPCNSRVDAALSGRGRFAEHAWFFCGSQYVRYDWASGVVTGQPTPIATGWHLPGAFAGGVDAAINGGGGFADRAYFFRDTEYVRYRWDTDAPDGPPERTVEKWPGLIEMLEVAHGATLAKGWTEGALKWLREDLARATAGQGSAPGIGAQALLTHFRLSSVDQRKAYLPMIIQGFEASKKIMEAPAGSVRFRTAAEAVADRGADAQGVPYPAYTYHRQSMSFTSTFTNFGPKCQAAMVLHESVHFHDPAATNANDLYEHGPAYATMSADQAAHNPSSYVSFAGHIAYGADVRYGAGRPDE